MLNLGDFFPVRPTWNLVQFGNPLDFDPCHKYCGKALIGEKRPIHLQSRSPLFLWWSAVVCYRPACVPVLDVESSDVNGFKINVHALRKPCLEEPDGSKVFVNSKSLFPFLLKPAERNHLGHLSQSLNKERWRSLNYPCES